MSRGRRNLVTGAIAFIAALGGVAVGHVIPWPQAQPGSELRRILSKLDLDQAQKKRIAGIERDFDMRRRSYEDTMRAQNVALAKAIQQELGNGPLVQQAVARSHQAMGELQGASIAEVFAIRQVLRADQARRYDEGVVRTLTAPAR